MKLRGENYRAIMQMKGLSPEIIIMSEVEAVHLVTGRILIAKIGEEIRTRRGLRP